MAIRLSVAEADQMDLLRGSLTRTEWLRFHFQRIVKRELGVLDPDD